MGSKPRIRKKPLPDAGSRGQKITGSRIRICSTAINKVYQRPFKKIEHLMLFRYGPGRQSRQQSLVRLNQLQQSILGWEGKEGFSSPSKSRETFPFSLTCILLGLFSFDFHRTVPLLLFLMKTLFCCFTLPSTEEWKLTSCKGIPRHQS
jgi:hypothetical protein